MPDQTFRFVWCIPRLHTYYVKSRNSAAKLGLLALCSLAPGLAQSTSPEQPAELCSAASVDAKPFVEERLAFWQKRLQLTEWNIVVAMTRRGDLKAKTLGGIHWDKGKKAAGIAVMDAVDYHVACDKMLDDMEFTIVHELIHLELASLPKSEASRSNEEHAVNRIAEALIKLHREESVVR